MTVLRNIQREAARQKHAMQWVRENIVAPHEFRAFDRAKALGQFSHARQRARGVKRGTLDTVLMVTGFPDIWAEWKNKGSRPDEGQAAEIARLRSIGRHADWFDSIVTYCAWLRSLGVPMRANAAIAALDHDLRADGEIERAEIKRGKTPRRYNVRAEKPTLARTRKVEALRAKVMF